MQNAKDTFYITLRDRIAALNPARTVLVRSTLRPGVLVEENELASSFDHQDAFRLRWTDASIDTHGPQPLITQRCVIRYATAGNTGNGGMDRGRLLAAMDTELAAAINSAPQRKQKQRYLPGAPSAMRTSIFWSDLTLAPAHANGELIERTATVDVFSYSEEDEQ
jgi:hypothetical protein